jgi:hypothetical protein
MDYRSRRGGIEALEHRFPAIAFRGFHPVATAALARAVDLIAGLGGGIVEGYPEPAGLPARYTRVVSAPASERLETLTILGALAAGDDESGFVGDNNGLDAVSEVEFGEDASDVALDGAFFDHEFCGDLGIGTPAGD